MRADEFFQIIGDIDDINITEAIDSRKKANIGSFVKWGTLAACLAIVTVLSIHTFEKDVQNETAFEQIVQTQDKEAASDNENQDIKTNNIQADDTQKTEENGTEYKTEIADDAAQAEESVAVAFEEKTLTEQAAEATPADDVSTDEDSFTTEEDNEKTKAPARGGGGGSASGGGSVFAGAYREAVDVNLLSDAAAEIFGGAYIGEKGEYVVIITDDTPENRKIIADELGIGSEAVFRNGKYTLSYLTELQNKISTAMSKGEIPFVMTCALMEAQNRIEVGVNTEDEAGLVKIRQLDELGGAIVFVSVSENMYQ